jgi:hypothetical protein
MSQKIELFTLQIPQQLVGLKKYFVLVKKSLFFKAQISFFTSSMT